jgi:hypothetical protein
MIAAFAVVDHKLINKVIVFTVANIIIRRKLSLIIAKIPKHDNKMISKLITIENNADNSVENKNLFLVLVLI